MKAAACVLSCSILCADVASASPPTPAELASALVNQAVVQPLADRARLGPFSRVYRGPTERRVRVLDAKALRDTSGAAFHRYAIDMRQDGGEWREGAIVGCTYITRNEVYVKRSDSYINAAAYLGGKADETSVARVHGGGCVVMHAR